MQSSSGRASMIQRLVLTRDGSGLCVILNSRSCACDPAEGMSLILVFEFYGIFKNGLLDCTMF